MPMIFCLGCNIEKGAWTQEKRGIGLAECYCRPSTYQRLPPASWSLWTWHRQGCRYQNPNRPELRPSLPLANCICNQSGCYRVYTMLLSSDRVRMEGGKKWHLTWIREDNKAFTIGTWAAKNQCSEMDKWVPEKQTAYCSLFPGYAFIYMLCTYILCRKRLCNVR